MSRFASGSIHVVTKLARFKCGISVEVKLIVNELIGSAGRHALFRHGVFRHWLVEIATAVCRGMVCL